MGADGLHSDGGAFLRATSELEVAERWYADSALEDLLGVPFGQINDARLYRGLDVLHAHKDAALCASAGALPELVWRGVRVPALRCDQHLF